MGRLSIVLLLAAFLGACGNKGALYLPETNISEIEKPAVTDY